MGKESESEEDSEHSEPEERVKKRRKQPERWKKNRIRVAKVQGLPHKNHVGNHVPRRETGPNCNCQMKCFDLFSAVKRQSLVEKMNGFDTKNLQDTFLQGLLEKMPIKRKRVRDLPQRCRTVKERSAGFRFFVLDGDIRTQVCKKAFCSLYGITMDRVRRLQKLLNTGTTPKDLRGKAANPHRISDDWCLRIHNHIDSFPTNRVHYQASEHRYLDARLNVKRMYRLFKKKFPNTPVKYRFYLKYFNENFNLSFGCPQIDVCSKCETLAVRLKDRTLSPTMRAAIQSEKDEHRKQANKFYAYMTEIRARSHAEADTLGIVFDYMQNLYLPWIPVQELFYLRKLTVNVFAIHNLKEETVMFYIYDETTAQKGANEVCSFVYDYIRTQVQDESIRKLYVFSDNCGGQNKNAMMLAMWSALRDTERFDLIEHVYPIRGHSYNPCDADFAQAKTLIRDHDRIYSVKTFAKLIIQSSDAGKFQVTIVSSDMILDFKSWTSSLFKKTAKAVGHPTVKFAIQKFNQFVFSRENGTALLARTHVNDDAMSFLFVLRNEHDPFLQWPTRAYEECLPITLQKRNDVLKLLEYIPRQFLSFYTDVCGNEILKPSRNRC